MHLVRDPEWEERMYNGLAEGLVIDGGRRSDDGMWHIRIVDAERDVPWVGSAFNNDCEAAIRAAVSCAP